MKVIKVIFTLALTLAIVLAVALTGGPDGRETPAPTEPSLSQSVVSPFPKRASRFLAETGNPRAAADHCYKNDEICYVLEGRNSTCCNNKCMDLSRDKHNCGACKNKCKFMRSCCGGECVNLAYDKRNCGSCGNKCMPGGYCIYGLCNYA